MTTFYIPFVLGEVEKQEGNVITIKPSQWAPGVWAGTEGLKLSNESIIEFVDFEKRQIIVNTADYPYLPNQSINTYDRY